MKGYRVSNVERFRQWEADEDADTDALIADIRGLGEPSQAMAAGTAFHRVLELAQPGQEIEQAREGEFRFSFRGDIAVSVTPIRELRASKVYVVDGEPIAISGQVDAIDGRLVIDHKTTGRFDPERYLDGYQWRLYADIFDADRFRWNVFELREIDESKLPRLEDGTNAAERCEPVDPVDVFALGPICYEVTAQHTLEQYRYPQLGADCQALVERFARFVREHVERELEAA